MRFIFWICLGLITYTYALYPALLALAHRWRGKRPGPALAAAGAPVPRVSVLVAAYNEADIITEKVQNSLRLDYPADRIEFLFGSDGSDDGTTALLEACPEPRVRAFAFPRRGKAATLNDLAVQARGEILVFSDANSLFEPQAVGRLVSHFADPRVGGVCGRLVLRTPGQPQAGGESLYWRYETAVKRLEGELGILASANGAIYAIRRALYRPLPIHTRVADDLIVGARVLQQGQAMTFEQEAVAHETTAESIRLDLERKIRVAEISFNALPHIVDLLAPRYGLAAWMLWSHKLLRWAVPGLLLGLAASSAGLWRRPFYRLAGWGQAALYAAALAGAWLEQHRPLPRWIAVPYYFVGANLALLLGALRAARGSGQATWTRTGRSRV